MANYVHIQGQLGQAMSRGLQQALDRRAAQEAAVADRLVHDGEATGFVELAGIGETMANISFPIMFVEKPVFTYGFEMAPGSWLTHGDFPLGTGVVAAWVVQPYNDMKLYAGARVGIVLIGGGGPMTFHYVFKGRSLTNPATP